MTLFRLLQRARAAWRGKAPSWLRAAVTTAAQVLLATLATSTLKVLDAVRLWSTIGTRPDFAVYLHDLGDATIVFSSMVVTAVWRRWRPPEHAYPQPQPLEEPK